MKNQHPGQKEASEGKGAAIVIISLVLVVLGIIALFATSVPLNLALFVSCYLIAIFIATKWSRDIVKFIGDNIGKWFR